MLINARPMCCCLKDGKGFFLLLSLAVQLSFEAAAVVEHSCVTLKGGGNNALTDLT